MGLPPAAVMRRRARRLVPVSGFLAVAAGTVALVDGSVDLTARWEVGFVWFTVVFVCSVATAAPGPLPRPDAAAASAGTEVTGR
jgi:hypothetical protein